MAEGRFISYLRVSTKRQGRSGLGLEAQRDSVLGFLNGGRWKLITEFKEVESGKVNERPELQKALASCRIHRATLLIAKLDRLSRDAHFLLGLEKAGVDFIACDMPQANKFTVGIMALVAQQEREAISARTKAALAAAKRRGVKLGGDRGNILEIARKGREVSALTRCTEATKRAKDVLPIIEQARREGAISLRQIANYLNEHNIPTVRDGQWSAVQVQRVLNRA